MGSVMLKWSPGLLYRAAQKAQRQECLQVPFHEADRASSDSATVSRLGGRWQCWWVDQDTVSVSSSLCNFSVLSVTLTVGSSFPYSGWSLRRRRLIVRRRLVDFVAVSFAELILVNLIVFLLFWWLWSFLGSMLGFLILCIFIVEVVSFWKLAQHCTYLFSVERRRISWLTLSLYVKSNSLRNASFMLIL